jgi:hypothetical protein
MLDPDSTLDAKGCRLRCSTILHEGTTFMLYTNNDAIGVQVQNIALPKTPLTCTFASG